LPNQNSGDFYATFGGDFCYSIAFSSDSNNWQIGNFENDYGKIIGGYNWTKLSGKPISKPIEGSYPGFHSKRTKKPKLLYNHCIVLNKDNNLQCFVFQFPHQLAGIGFLEQSEVDKKTISELKKPAQHIWTVKLSDNKEPRSADNKTIVRGSYKNTPMTPLCYFGEIFVPTYEHGIVVVDEALGKIVCKESDIKSNEPNIKNYESCIKSTESCIKSDNLAPTYDRPLISPIASDVHIEKDCSPVNCGPHCRASRCNPLRHGADCGDDGLCKCPEYQGDCRENLYTTKIFCSDIKGRLSCFNIDGYIDDEKTVREDFRKKHKIVNLRKFPKAFSKAWTSQHKITDTPCIHEGYIFFIEDFNKITCVKKCSGEKMWTTNLNELSNTHCFGSTKWYGPVLAGSLLYIVGDMGNLLSFNPDSSLHKMYDVEGNVSTAPSVIEKKLIITRDDGIIVAFA
jgi:outer membrane protein assembly factor BamB